MILTDVSWPGFVLKGLARCPVCSSTQPYRLYREGVSMMTALRVAQDEISRWGCLHCNEGRDHPTPAGTQQLSDEPLQRALADQERVDQQRMEALEEQLLHDANAENCERDTPDEEGV